MAKDWTKDERLTKAYDYLAGVDQGLKTHVEQRIAGIVDPLKVEAIKDSLSLQGNKLYAMFGSSDKGLALRALLLCQRAYLFGDTWSLGNGGAFPWAYMGDHAQSTAMCRNHWINKTENQLRQALLAYLPTANPVKEDVLQAAFRIKTGILDQVAPWEKITRTMSDFPGGRVCFDGLCWWLFKAGYVSLRWMAREKGRMVPQNCNDILGWGITQIDTTAWDPATYRATINGIQRGLIVNWRGRGDAHAVCHWAMTLGGGKAVGVNNTKEERGGVKTVFDPGGGTPYGIFTIESMCTVYNAKLGGFILATTDPFNIPTKI
jgi:hypothetical protein